MENKVFELLTKMYSEFSIRFDGLESDVGVLKSDVGVLKSDAGVLKSDVGVLKSDVGGLKNDIIRLENKVDSSTKALFDGYKQTYEKLIVVEKKIDNISAKVEKHDIEIQILKRKAISV